MDELLIAKMGISYICSQITNNRKNKHRIKIHANQQQKLYKNRKIDLITN